MVGSVDVDDVSISSRGSSRRAARFGVLAAVALGASQGGCGQSPPDSGQPLEGATLVAGSSVLRHGLLTLPRSGGLPELRAVDDPLRVRWRGEREVPASMEAHALGRAVVLRAEDGRISLYDPSTETVRDLGSASGDARWIGSDDGGAFVTDGEALVVRAGGSRHIETDGTILWAAPAGSERVVALVDTRGGHRLEVWEDGDAPVSSEPVDSPGPAVLTGAGREVVLPEGEGHRLVERTLPELHPTERADLDAAPVLLATSPSEHRLFAVPGGEDRLVVIDRYAWETLARTRTKGSVRAVRPSLTGDLLLYEDEAGVWALAPTANSPTAVDSEWRSDLPLALPGGAVLAIRHGEVRVIAPDGSPGEVVPNGADDWWLPVRWRPRAVEMLAEAPDPGADTTAEVGERPPALQDVGITTLGQVSPRAVAVAPAGRHPTAPGDRASLDVATAGATARVPNGFYAVATSSRQLPTLRDLQRSLEGSGYPTQVLPRVDEANETWYRLLVGPYESRDRAEATASRLRRERGIAAWIQEVSGGFETPGDS